MRLFVLLLPFLELWTLIELGSNIGAFQTIGYVLLTMILGSWVIRAQGEGMLQKVKNEFEGAKVLNPGLLADGLSMVFCGLLLIVPGLITDALGVLMMIGPLRRFVLRRTRPVDVNVESSITLEGEFRRLDD